MIRINLIPFRAARKKENIRRQVSLFLLSFFLVLILLVWFNFSLSKKIEVLNDKVKSTQRELDTYREINREIAEIKNKLKILKAKTEVIEKLQASRREPVRMLDKMTELVVPKRMWFTKFKASEKVSKDAAPTTKKGKKGQPNKKVKPSKPETITVLEIKGVALDNKTVADFMTRLEGSPVFSNINLKTIQQITIKDVNLKEFVVTLQKVTPDKIKKGESNESVKVSSARVGKYEKK